MIQEIINNKKLGDLYGLLIKHSNRLNLRGDTADLYDLSKNIFNNPDRYTGLLTKLKKYEKDN